MDIGKISERAMSMSDETWQRHMNPWSGWSRITVLPLLAFSIWSHIWIGWGAIFLITLVLVWMWLNPRLFGVPQSTDNWMSQGVIGERLWLAKKRQPIPDHHERVTFVLNIANGLGLLLLIYGLWSLDFGLTLAGLITSMGAKMWFLDRMVWLKTDMSTNQQEAEQGDDES